MWEKKRMEGKMSYIKQIRKRCKDCMPDSVSDITKCESTECRLHPFRMGKRGKSDLTPLKSIKKYCKDFCMNGSYEELVHCASPSCSLFGYRMGKNPKRARPDLKGVPVPRKQKIRED
jgi:hypothetical protein